MCFMTLMNCIMETKFAAIMELINTLISYIDCIILMKHIILYQFIDLMRLYNRLNSLDQLYLLN